MYQGIAKIVRQSAQQTGGTLQIQHRLTRRPGPMQILPHPCCPNPIWRANCASASTSLLLELRSRFGDASEPTVLVRCSQGIANSYGEEDIVFSGRLIRESSWDPSKNDFRRQKGGYLLPSREIRMTFCSPCSHLVVRYKPPERRIVVSLTASFQIIHTRIECVY